MWVPPVSQNTMTPPTPFELKETKVSFQNFPFSCRWHANTPMKNEGILRIPINAPTGIRTRVTAVKGPHSWPLNYRGVFIITNLSIKVYSLTLFKFSSQACVSILVPSKTLNCEFLIELKIVNFQYLNYRGVMLF